MAKTKKAKRKKKAKISLDSPRCLEAQARLGQNRDTLTVKQFSTFSSEHSDLKEKDLKLKYQFYIKQVKALIELVEAERAHMIKEQERMDRRKKILMDEKKRQVKKLNVEKQYEERRAMQKQKDIQVELKAASQCTERQQYLAEQIHIREAESRKIQQVAMNKRDAELKDLVAKKHQEMMMEKQKWAESAAAYARLNAEMEERRVRQRHDAKMEVAKKREVAEGMRNEHMSEMERLKEIQMKLANDKVRKEKAQMEELRLETDKLKDRLEQKLRDVRIASKQQLEHVDKKGLRGAQKRNKPANTAGLTMGKPPQAGTGRLKPRTPENGMLDPL